jgi:hypothetical protein
LVSIVIVSGESRWEQDEAGRWVEMPHDEMDPDEWAVDPEDWATDPNG